MKNSARFACFALYGLSFVMLVAALLVWNDRTARARQTHLQQEMAAQQERSQHAVALLSRAFEAENGMTYAARAHTMTAYGDQKIKNVAWMVQAPDHLYVKYLDGHYKGMQFGYSQRWFYRQCNQTGRKMAYAEVEKMPTRSAAHRFALLLQNYRAQWVKSDKLQGRAVEVVQLLPIHPVEGARGPAQRIWIDAENGLPMRTECFDYKLRPTLDTSLSDIDLSPRITSATFKAPAQILDMTKTTPWMTRDLGGDKAKVETITGLVAPLATYLPPGFVFEHVGVYLLEGLTKQFVAPPQLTDYAALTRYTDGLNALTIFALRQADKKGDNEDYNFGPGTLVMRDVPDGVIVAVADLPPPVLRKVLASTPEKIAR